MKKLSGLLCVIVLVFGLVGTANAATYLGPTPYLSFSDSPFSGISFEYFYLEDFEDSQLNTPGVTDPRGSTWLSDQMDSVDADDGVIDGSGSTGKSWVIKGYLGYPSPPFASLTFTFDSSILGNFPTHAGIVWTDAADPLTTSVYLEGFDVFGSSLGVFGPWAVGDGSTLGETAEDRFLGVINFDGISAIKIYQDAFQLEVDHLQYGFATPVPIPSAIWLLGSAFIGLVGLRKKFKKA